jgi:Delta7-sterol 5-desaturase
MKNSASWAETLQRITTAEFLQYFVLAGIAYALFYVVLKKYIQHKKIQQREPKRDMLRHEIMYSISSLLIFSSMGLGVHWLAAHGYTLMYTDISEYGMPYFIFSVVAMIGFHDTFFYWAHRFMHLKKVYPIVHLVHHKSTNPTPWAAFSFHPLEAFIQYLSLPIIVMILPAHFYAILIWFSFSFFLNIGGHLGYEFFNTGFTKHPLKGLSNTSTHHNMHHSLFDCNYGIYFNVWDKLMKTNHETYHDTFEKVASKAKPKELNNGSMFI